MPRREWAQQVIHHRGTKHPLKQSHRAIIRAVQKVAAQALSDGILTNEHIYNGATFASRTAVIIKYPKVFDR